MGIVVMTNNRSLYGLKILNGLCRSRVFPAAIVVVHQPPGYYLRLLNSVRRRVGVADALVFSVIRLLKSPRPPSVWKGLPFVRDYEAFGSPVIHSRGTNSPHTQMVLERLSPDLVVLGQTGIVRENVLKTARVGAINAHPGTLPYYRGIDAFKWAVHNAEPERIGCTLHWVDKGVDTGPVISTLRYALTVTDTFDSLEDSLYDMCTAMIAEFCAAVVQQGLRRSGEAQCPTAGRQYYKMPLALEKACRRKFEAMIKSLDAVPAP